MSVTSFGRDITTGSDPTKPNQDIDKHIANLGAGYEQAIRNNPALYNNYHSDIWDAIGNIFGFNTREDSYRLDLQQRSDAYMSQLYNQKREEDYNDPTAQVARERAAGLNPDINGSITPGTAAESTEPETPTAPEPTITPESLFQSFGQVLSFGISFASQISDLSAKALTLSSSRVALRESIANQAITDWDNYVASHGTSYIGNANAYRDWVKDVHTLGTKYTNPFPKGSYEGRTYTKAAEMYRLNHPAVAKKYFDTHNAVLRSALDYGSNPAYGVGKSGDFTVVLDAFKPLAVLRKQTMFDTARNESIEASSTIPAELDARTSNANLSKQQSDKSYDVGKTISQIISNLSGIADDDKYPDVVRFLANGCLMAMYFFGSKFGIQ